MFNVCLSDLFDDAFIEKLKNCLQNENKYMQLLIITRFRALVMQELHEKRPDIQDIARCSRDILIQELGPYCSLINTIYVDGKSLFCIRSGMDLEVKM